MERWTTSLITFKKRVKYWAVGTGNVFLDLLFPPLCLLCHAESRALFCPICLDLLALIDPAFRCRHCFREGPSLCRQCARTPRLAAPRAHLFEPTHIARRLHSLLEREQDAALAHLMASLLIVQWGRLAWPLPDRIALIPSQHPQAALREIAERTAAMLNRPLFEEFRLQWVRPFRWRIKRKQADLLERERILLLDLSSTFSEKRESILALWPACPQEIYLLSLFEERETLNLSH